MSLMLVHFMRKCCSGKTKWHDWTVIVCKYRQTDPWCEKIPAISSPTVHANFFPFEIEFHPLRGLAQIEMFQFVQFMYFTPTIDCLRVIRKCTLNGMMDRVTAAWFGERAIFTSDKRIRQTRKNLFGFHLARVNRGNMMQNLWRNKTWSHKRASKREWISNFY